MVRSCNLQPVPKAYDFATAKSLLQTVLLRKRVNNWAGISWSMLMTLIPRSQSPNKFHQHVRAPSKFERWLSERPRRMLSTEAICRPPIGYVTLTGMPDLHQDLDRVFREEYGRIIAT